MPIGTTALLLAGGAALAKGAGQIASARAGKLTKEEKDELKRLQEAQAAGQLGLTEAQEGRLEQQFLGTRGGMLREQQQQALQQQAAGGPVSGRDIFLREQMRQKGQQDLIAQENLLRAQAQASAEQQQLARIQQLRGQEIQTKAATRAAVGETIGGALGAGADLAMLGAMGKIDPMAFEGEMTNWFGGISANTASQTTSG